MRARNRLKLRSAPLLPQDRVILSLFDHSGTWSDPYAQAGYRVIRVDIQDGVDVRLLEYMGPVWGILAAPPCTVFSRAGMRWPRTPEEMAEAIGLVAHVHRFVVACRPAWWAMENPVGTLIDYAGPYRFKFHPHEFGGWIPGGGDAYTKETCLWGEFRIPERRPVPPVEGSRIHKLPGAHRGDTPEQAARKRNARSIAPRGFALAFFAANP